MGKGRPDVVEQIEVFELLRSQGWVDAAAAFANGSELLAFVGEGAAGVTAVVGLLDLLMQPTTACPYAACRGARIGDPAFSSCAPTSWMMDTTPEDALS
jgi:hypothetical protein